MSIFTANRRAHIARLFALSLLTPYIYADANVKPAPAQENHPLMTPPPKLPSRPQKREYLEDCFGSTGSCNMYMTVRDLCEILVHEKEHDLANNQCLCSNGYVPALSMCEDCQKKYNTEIIYPASLASQSCTDDGFSVAKMSSDIPLSIEDLVRPTLLASQATETSTTESTSTDSTETSESTSTTSISSIDSDSQTTSSRDGFAIGVGPGGGDSPATTSSTDAAATSDVQSPSHSPLRATQDNGNGGDVGGALSIRSGSWEAAMLSLALSGGSVGYYLLF